MQISRLYGIAGAKQAQATTIIIDIFRATSLEAYILANGAKEILPVATKEEAFALRENHLNYLLVGEEKGIKVNGFDYGNSPHEIRSVDFNGKTIVHRSSEGTQGIVNAHNATEIICGSFLVANAICTYVQQTQPDTVSLVAMGGRQGEDNMFADYIEQRIKGFSPKLEKIIETLKEHENSQRFLDPREINYPVEDFYLCLRADLFNFVPKVIIKDHRLTIMAMNIDQ